MEDGLALYTSRDVHGIGRMANLVRERLHGDRTYYNRNRHINYTTVCALSCKFCSFYAQKGGPDPYTMSLDEVRARLRDHMDIPITEVHMVAGINPTTHQLRQVTLVGPFTSKSDATYVLTLSGYDEKVAISLPATS